MTQPISGRKPIPSPSDDPLADFPFLRHARDEFFTALSPTSSHVFAGEEVERTKSAPRREAASIDVGDTPSEKFGAPGRINLPGVGQAVRRAVEEVRGRDVEEWQALFVLARHLKAVPGYDPEADPEPVQWFCRATGVHPAMGELDFPARWEAVRAPHLDVRAAAAGLARSHPVPVAGLADRLLEAAGFAYHLQSFTRPHPFILTYEELGRFLIPGLGSDTRDTNRAKQFGGRVIGRLVAAGVLRVVDDRYVPHRKGRTYLFVGTLEVDA